MSDAEKKDQKHWLDHASFYNAIAGVVLSVVVAIGTCSVNSQTAEDRRLQWRPVLSLNVRASASDSRDALGLFLENAGKGPARLEGACQAGGVFERVDISGLRQSLGRIRPGAVVASGATIPLLMYTPEEGKAWTSAAEDKILALFEQSKKWQVTIYYSSLYAPDGCFQVRRRLLQGEWSEQTQPHSCGDYFCDADEQPVR